MRRMHAVAAAVAAILGLAGCGSQVQTSGLDLPEYEGTAPAGDGPTAGDESAADLLASAQAAIAEAETVTLAGETGGSGDATLTADISFNGPDGTGTFSIGAGTFAVLLVDGSAWYKGDSAAYSAFGVNTASVTKKIDGRWIIAGSSNPKLAQLDVVTSREAFLSDFVDPGSEVTTTEPETIGGVEVIGLANDTGTLYIDTETRLPARLVMPGDDGTGITFSYGPVDKPTAPPADQIVDLADLR